MFTYAGALALAASTVFGHAIVETPEPRKPGTMSAASCGAAVSEVLERGLFSHLVPSIFRHY